MSTPITPKRILSIDGGGIRCLIAVEILCTYETGLQERTGNSNLRLCDHFDLVAGTSAGAILASAISLGIPLTEIRQFVIDNAVNLFKPSAFLKRHRSLYDERVLESNMQEWFGMDTTLGSEKLRTLVFLIMRNMTTDSQWIVSNNPTAKFNQRNLDDCNLNIPLWKLARASAAAPAYYKPVSIEFGVKNPYSYLFADGALTGFLNPSFKAFQYATTECYGLNWPGGENQIWLVSIGSGDTRHQRPKLKLNDINIVNAMLRVPNAMIYASIREQDILCRTFGRCVSGEKIDMELGDMKDIDTALNPRLFTYHRFNPSVSKEGLKQLGLNHINTRDVVRIDAVKSVALLSEIGKAAAELIPEDAYI